MPSRPRTKTPGAAWGSDRVKKEVNKMKSNATQSNRARRGAKSSKRTAKKHAKSLKSKSSVLTKRTPRLDRETFVTSRELDFFTEKGLTAQIGHGIED